MPVPERELVDNALDRARKHVSDMPATDPTWALADVLVSCTEALVRQIRDADDTIATYLCDEVLKPRLDDLTKVIGGNLGPIAHAATQGKKGGLFG